MSSESEELRYISIKTEKIEGHVSQIAERQSSFDWTLGVVVVLLGLIVWRVW